MVFPMRRNMLPSGKHTKSYWKWSFIVSFPINSMVIFQFAMLNYQRVNDFWVMDIEWYMIYIYILVGGAMCPSWKIWKSMGRIIPYIMGKKCWNHQPVYIYIMLLSLSDKRTPLCLEGWPLASEARNRSRVPDPGFFSGLVHVSTS